MNRSLLFVISLISMTALACGKKNGSQQCNLASLTDSTTAVQAVTQFSYDAENRLSSVVVTGQKACRRTFQYSGNTVIFTVSDTTTGVRAETDTLVINSRGLIQSQATYLPTSGSYSYETYTYDDAGNPVTSTETNNGAPGDTLVYAYSGGNLIYETVKGENIHKTDFSYYATLNYQYGDPTDFRQLLYYGAYYYKNKNMVNVLSSPGTSYKNYSYSYSNGRIASSVCRQWSPANPDTIVHTISYSYTCK